MYKKTWSVICKSYLLLYSICLVWVVWSNTAHLTLAMKLLRWACISQRWTAAFHMLKDQNTNRLMGKKPKINAEILVWGKNIVKTYVCLNVPKQQMEAVQQDVCTKEYGIKTVRHAICKSN